MFEELENTSNEKLLEYLTKLRAAQVIITSIKDDKDFNLLHHAVLKG